MKRENTDEGVDILIDAFKLLLKDMPDLHLVIVGDGDIKK
jgi:glycosyltransferase involved in cell wall biosynthesis